MPNVLRIAALACAAALAAHAADNELTAQEKKDGWKLLFDGKTFANWEDPTKKTPPGDSFVIDNGTLRSVPRPKLDEDLFSAGTYGDFELVWDWKISPAGNSGVKYRIQDRVWLTGGGRGQKFEDTVNAAMKDRKTARPERGQEYVIGFEYQMLDNEKNPDARRGTNHRAGALYDMISPTKDATKPVGEWNHSRLVVKGDHVEHWLNGEKVVDGSLKDPQGAKNTAQRWGADSPVTRLLVDQPRKECQISLQNHNSDAWFKNIKIRKL